MKWLILPRLAVCLAVVLSITTGCEYPLNPHDDEDVPDPTGSGILTGWWVGHWIWDSPSGKIVNMEERWSVSHEGSSVTIVHVVDYGYPTREQVESVPATYDQSSRILTTQSGDRFTLSADNNILVSMDPLRDTTKTVEPMVRQ